MEEKNPTFLLSFVSVIVLAYLIKRGKGVLAYTDITDKNAKKNPAYGRQSISRPMRIVAPIPQTVTVTVTVGWTKNTQEPIFFLKN